MEGAGNACHAKLGKLTTKTDQTEKAALHEALLLLKQSSAFSDKEAARKGDHRFQSSKAFETVETLLRSSPRQRPNILPAGRDLPSRDHAGRNAVPWSEQQDSRERVAKKPTDHCEEPNYCSVTSSFQSMTTNEDEATDVDTESCQPEPPRSQWKSFEIGNEREVLSFLMDRLQRLQQVPMKKIAKLWIRGICPRKQAVFPYSGIKKKQANDDEGQPMWWPADTCKFREPDHVSRTERNNLCLHLLRLRPSAEQLHEWNGRGMPPNEIHRTQGWTKFLASLAPVSCLEELREKSSDKALRRRRLLEQMYHVAQMEEDYLDGGYDAKAKYSYREPMDRTAPLKRSRRARDTVKHSTPTSPATPTSDDPAPIKRHRGLVGEDTPRAVKDEVMMENEGVMDVDAIPETTTNTMPQGLQSDEAPPRTETRSVVTLGSVASESRPRPQQNKSTSALHWEPLDNTGPVYGFRADERVPAPRPFRPSPMLPLYGNDPWATFDNMSGVGYAHAPSEISAYRVGNVPQPHFDATAAQSFFPFSVPFPDVGMLPAVHHEQHGEFAMSMQHYPTGQLQPTAQGGPPTSFADYYDYQHPPMAPPPLDPNFAMYAADASVTWPHELPRSHEST